VSIADLLAGRARATADYDGAEVAEAYDDVDLEWAAIDGNVAIADTRYRRTLVATGSEARQFLQGQLSHSLATLKDGRGAPSLLLTAQGHVVSILAAYDAGEAIELVVEERHLDRTRARLEQFLVADDVELEERPPSDRFTLVGRNVPRMVADFGIDVPREDPTSAAGWFVRRVRIGGVNAVLYGRGDLRVPAVEFVCADGASLWREIEQQGVRAVGAHALELVRVESGLPRYGVDVDETRIALEARLEWAIHFRKGCYVGQEIIERAVSRGRVNRQLCLLATEEPAMAGDLVHDTGEKEVVTSTAISPRSGPICLGYALRELAEPGKQLTLVRGDHHTIQARVLPWPRREVYAGR
jgi:folate-binding protein YgfZ